jgi:Ca2+-binding RTX toxin-like protein
MSGKEIPMSGFEMLEGRTMMSANIEAGVLVVTGTEAADTIRVTQQDAATIRTSDGVEVKFFEASLVNSVRVEGLGGADTIELGVNGQSVLQKASLINGGDGADRITGGARSDTINGGAGNDTLTGLGGNDRLDGGDGDNQMFGGDGNDTMLGGLGADLFDGGNQTDKVDYTNRTASVSVVIDDLANDGQLVNVPLGRPVREGDNVKTNVEDVFTGSGDDSIIASVANIDNRFSGGAGNDRLRGRNGKDTLFGGAGNDTLIGAGQDDALRGEAGNDLLDGGADNDDLRGGTENDILIGSTGVDQMRGDEGDDFIFAADNTVDGVIDGGTGQNFFSGDATDVFSNVQITD